MDLDSLNALFFSEEPAVDQELPLSVDPTPDLLYYHDSLKRYMSYPEFKHRQADGNFDRSRKASGRRAVPSDKRERQLTEYLEGLGLKVSHG